MSLVFLHFQDGFGNDLELICDGFTLVWSWDPTSVSHPINGNLNVNNSELHALEPIGVSAKQCANMQTSISTSLKCDDDCEYIATIVKNAR